MYVSMSGDASFGSSVFGLSEKLIGWSKKSDLSDLDLLAADQVYLFTLSRMSQVYV